MRSRTYRTESPITNPNTISNIGRALLVVAILIAVIVAFRWIGERRVQRVSAHVPALSQQADTITLTVDNPEWPELTELRFTVDEVDNAFILTDVDGDQFRCTKRPVVIADMELCPYYAQIQR